MPRQMKDIVNLSLVHRTWTGLAQRALRRRAVLVGPGLALFLRSPLCGPWVTRLGILGVDNPLRRGYGIEWASLEALVARTPHLTQLQIENDDYSADSSSFFRSLRAMHSLKRLTFSLDGIENLFFFGLCQILPNLQDLAFLQVELGDDTMPSRSQANSQDVPPSPPPSRLKAVVLKITDAHSCPYDHISWLVRPAGDFALDLLATSQEEMHNILTDRKIYALRLISAIERPFAVVKTLYADFYVDTRGTAVRRRNRLEASHLGESLVSRPSHPAR